MRIPQIADRMRDIGTAEGLPELLALADELRRRPSSRVAPTSRRMTPALEVQIRAYCMARPSRTQAEVARVFGVNQGRVSEALRGKRV